MSPNKLACAVFTVCLPIVSDLNADDWSQWRGVDRANHSAETGLFESWGADGPKLSWISSGMGSGYASVAVVGDRAYTSGDFDDGQAVVAIDVANGKTVWKQLLNQKPPKHGYPGSRTTPTVDGDHLYVVSSDGIVACLQTKDGSKVWSRNFKDWGGKMMSGWGFSESPLVDGDVVVCTPGGSKGLLVALNKKTGKEVWSCAAPKWTDEKGVNGKNLRNGAGYASPIISNGAGVKQYVQLVGRGLVGVRAKDGKYLWRYSRVSNGTANIPTAIVDGDNIFTSTAYGTGAALLKLTANGEQVNAEEVYWLDGKTFQNKHGGMTLVDGHIYCGHGNGNGLPVCLNMKSGEVTWGPERAKGKGEASLVVADGHIVWRREDGTVILTKVNPKTMDVVGAFKPEFQKGKTWAHPVIANGKLYLREQDKMMCYQLR